MQIVLEKITKNYKNKIKLKSKQRSRSAKLNVFNEVNKIALY